MQPSRFWIDLGAEHRGALEEYGIGYPSQLFDPKRLRFVGPGETDEMAPVQASFAQAAYRIPAGL